MEAPSLGLLTRIDRGMLAAYCQAHALWVEAVQAIGRYGTMVKSPNGYPMQSPYVAVANKQVEIMGRIAAEFGMTPSCAVLDVREIAYDPWNATHIALRLQDEGAKMIEFRQGFRSMSAPTRELEKLVVSRKLAHGGNPVTRWMGVQRGRGAGSRGEPQVYRAHRWHRRDDHGAGARHGRPGGAAALVPSVHFLRGQLSSDW
jgi:hypothetical protein